MSDHDQTPMSRRNPKRRGFPRPAASTEKPLSAREQRFVDEYLVDLKGGSGSDPRRVFPEDGQGPSVADLNQT